VDTIIQQAVTVQASNINGETIPPNFYGQPYLPDGSQQSSTPLVPSQQYSLTPAKIPVVNGSSFMTYLLSVKDPSKFNHLPLSPSFQMSHIEHQISKVSYADGYQASSWLSFVIPVTANAMGSMDIPIPLRAYPTPPSLSAQQFTQAQNPQ